MNKTLVRGLGSTPWSDAAPLLLVVAAVLWTGLMVADAGGWSTVFSTEAVWTAYAPLDGDSGAPFDSQPWAFLSVNGDLVIIALSALLAGLALAGRRWPTVVLIPVIAVAFLGWVRDMGRLDYVNVPLALESGGDDIAPEMAITLYGVVGLLLAAAFVTALVRAMTGTVAAQRRTRAGLQGAGHLTEGRDLDDLARTRTGFTPTTAAVLVAALLLTLAMPRLALWIRDAMESVLGTAPEALRIHREYTNDLDSAGAHGLWLLVAAIVTVFVGALALPRRAPAAATALTLLSIAFVIPAFWLFGAVLEEVVALDWIVDHAVLAMWAVVFAIGFVFAASCFARAGREMAARNAATQVESRAADHQV